MKITNFYSKIFIALFTISLLLLGLYKNSKFDNAFAETFRLRERILSWTMNFKFLGLRDNFYSDLMYTRDHQWLNYTGENSLDDYQNISAFSDEQLETIHVKLRNVRDSLNERGIKFYLVVPPNKNTIYPGDLDKIAPKFQPISKLDQLIEYETTHSGMEVIDIRQDLLEAKETNQVFYSTDTHWNDYGSWLGYSKIMKSITQDFPALTANPIEKFLINQRPYSGDLAILSGHLLVDEVTQTFTLKNPREVKHDNTVLESGVTVVRSSINDPDLPKALIFRDSFYTHLHNYMSQHFSKSVCLWSFTFDYGMVEEFKPDLVIYEITERYIDELLRLP